MVQERKVNELAIPTPKTIGEAVERGIPLVMVEKVTGSESIFYALEIALLDVTALVNIDPRLNIQKGQTRGIAESILQNFPAESLEDFKLAFSRGASGFYGEIYRLDGAVITRWIQLYLEEKYAYIEQQAAKEKRETRTVEATIDYAALIERRKKEIQEQTDQKRHVIEHQKQIAKDVIDGKETAIYTPNKEKAEAATLRNEYLRANYDLTTGKRLAGWKSFEEWSVVLPL